MAKRMEDMTREEILKEFEGAPVAFRVPRRPKKLVPLTLRVHPDLIRMLAKHAKEQGIRGYTTMARLLLEAAATRPAKTLADDIAESVVNKLRRRKVA